jgi:glutathionyl-hydroquinone reductase
MERLLRVLSRVFTALQPERGLYSLKVVQDKTFTFTRGRTKMVYIVMSCPTACRTLKVRGLARPPLHPSTHCTSRHDT